MTCLCRTFLPTPEDACSSPSDLGRAGGKARTLLLDEHSPPSLQTRGFPTGPGEWRMLPGDAGWTRTDALGPDRSGEKTHFESKPGTGHALIWLLCLGPDPHPGVRLRNADHSPVPGTATTEINYLVTGRPDPGGPCGPHPTRSRCMQPLLLIPV